MMRKYLPKSAIGLEVEAEDWVSAVREAGKLLVNEGIAKEEYTEAMIDTVKELGAYIVATKGLAIPHARPEDGALKVGCSLITLKSPVLISEDRDPIDIVLAFTAIDNKSHLNLLQEISSTCGDKEKLEAIRQANSPEEVIKIFENGEK